MKDLYKIVEGIFDINNDEHIEDVSDKIINKTIESCLNNQHFVYNKKTRLLKARGTTISLVAGCDPAASEILDKVCIFTSRLGLQQTYSRIPLKTLLQYVEGIDTNILIHNSLFYKCPDFKLKDLNLVGKNNMIKFTNEAHIPFFDDSYIDHSWTLNYNYDKERQQTFQEVNNKLLNKFDKVLIDITYSISPYSINDRNAFVNDLKNCNSKVLALSGIKYLFTNYQEKLPYNNTKEMIEYITHTGKFKNKLYFAKDSTCDILEQIIKNNPNSKILVSCGFDGYFYIYLEDDQIRAKSITGKAPWDKI